MSFQQYNESIAASKIVTASLFSWLAKPALLFPTRLKHQLSACVIPPITCKPSSSLLTIYSMYSLFTFHFPISISYSLIMNDTPTRSLSRPLQHPITTPRPCGRRITQPRNRQHLTCLIITPSTTNTLPIKCHITDNRANTQNRDVGQRIRIFIHSPC